MSADIETARLAWLAEDTRQRLDRSIRDLYEAGRNLLEAKTLCKAQDIAWGAYLRDQVGLRSERTDFRGQTRMANYLMAIARRFDPESANLANFTKTALYALTAKSTSADAIQAASALSSTQMVDQRTATVLRDAPPAIRDRVVRRELTTPQAEGLIAALPRIQSEQVRTLAETRVSDPEAALVLDELARRDPDQLEVIVHTGHLQGTQVVPVEELRGRDLREHLNQVAYEAKQSSFVSIMGRWKAVVVDDADGDTVTLKLARGNFDLAAGEVIYLSLERKV